MSGERYVFEYAVLRVVPRVERGEFLNAGVLVYCQALDFLKAATYLDVERLRALDPTADVEAVNDALTAVVDVCAGTATGPAGEAHIGKRFRWLTAPRSTIIQTGPVHTGLTYDPDAEVERLLRLVVLPIDR